MKNTISVFLALFIPSLLLANQRILLRDTSDATSEVQSSLVVTNGAIITSTNCIPPIAVQGVSTSAGAGDSGKIAKLDGTGKFDSSFIPAAAGGGASTTLTLTNVIMGADVAGITSYTNLVSCASTSTNGIVVVQCQVLYRTDASGTATLNAYKLLSVQGSTTNTLMEAYEGQGGAANQAVLSHVMGYDTLTGTARTYILQGKVNAADAGDYWTSKGTDNSAAAYTSTNATQMILIQQPQ